MTPRKLGFALVRGRSMEPTLHEGDRLLVLYGARPRPGKLAIVRLPNDSKGEPRPLAVKRLSRPDPEGGDGWWVERDNPREGLDSWTVGAIPAAGIRARVLLRMPNRLHMPVPARLR
ncbi:MAG: S24 family peptidase [Dermatophilaceae bacterium]|nr:S24 family peptidase [Dermatophilaceae bacterium]